VRRERRIYPLTAWLLLAALVAHAFCTGSASGQTVQPPARIPMPDNAKITLLIQTHMAALSHANLTGNYTVLYALGSPAFQGVNSPAKLAANFAYFRSQGIDISPAILLPPLLTSPARMEAGDVLRVTGIYDTNPQRVLFEMAFQAVDKAWRLAGIAVSTAAVNHASVQAPAQAPAAAKTPKEVKATTK
jgi:hypothetical protein